MSELFMEIFKELPRQGPGDTASTTSALSMCTALPDRPSILDIGCGSGAQTLVLAEICKGMITAVDSSPVLLQRLVERVHTAGFGDRIKPLELNMENIDSKLGVFDLIWAEGSIYNMGFAKGLQHFRPLLKNQGYLAATEISWLKAAVPDEPREFWTSNYAEIATIPEKLRVVEESGYNHVGHFVLPESAWRKGYYEPMQNRVDALRPTYRADPAAQDLMHALEAEIDLYRRYSDCYGYVFYVMQKRRPS